MSSVYQNVVRPLLFQLDPELAHSLVISFGKTLCNSSFFLDRLSAIFRYEHSYLEQTLWGIKFSNPLGLAAGFDKNAELLPLWQALGFGFAEIEFKY